MKASENYLLSLLSNNDLTFFIPPYQRNYEWDKEQCKTFFNDIVKTVESNLTGKYSEHFFGSIVYVENKSAFGEPDRLILTDGQQRITTTMLFLLALRDIVSDAKVKKLIDDKYLKNKNITGDVEKQVKLKQVEADWDAFLKIVLNKYLTKENQKSIVYRNYSYFKNELKKLQKKNELNLLEMISNGLDKFSIVTIELEPEKNSWENPQEIFESMNSLGKPLSLADLVRNYLLLGLDIEQQEKYYREYWLHIENTIGENLSGFVRDYMQLKTCSGQKTATQSNYKDLYAEFKKVFIDIDIKELFEELHEHSTYYSYISLGKKSGNEEFDAIMSDLRTLNATTANSFLLGLVAEWKRDNLNDNEIVEILKVIKVFLLRRRILGDTNAESKSFPSLAKEIELITKANDKKDFMYQLLSSQHYNFRLPNDYEVYNGLNTMNFFVNGYARFIFALIEEELTGIRPDLEDKSVRLEAVMPRTLNNHWKAYLGDDHEAIHYEYSNNIGNITLIRNKSGLGSRTFSEKKEVFSRKTGLRISRENLGDKQVWNKSNMEIRKEWLINLLLDRVIPIPEDIKFKNNFATRTRRGLSFLELQLINEEINLIGDQGVKAKVISDNEVLFEGQKWKLSPLTYEIKKRKNDLNKSGSYTGASYWEYEGIKLADII